MDTLTSMRVYARVVDSGGFSAAARAVGLSTAMVSKHVAALERRLGVTLLARTTRRVAPTEAGARYHALCVELLQALDEAERQVGAEGAEPIGCLRVTAPVEFGNLHVAPLVPALLRRYPGLTVSLDFTNRIVDLVEEGLDVAIRIAGELDSALAGRQIATSRLVAVAAPAYLRRRGTPRSPDALARHATLSFALGPGRRWAFEHDDGRRAVAEVGAALLSTSSEALRAAACAGAGVALLPTFLVGPDVAAGRLRTLLPGWRGGTLKVFALYPQRRLHPARLRAFVDALVERWGGDPERDPFAP